MKIVYLMIYTIAYVQKYIYRGNLSNRVKAYKNQVQKEMETSLWRYGAFAAKSSSILLLRLLYIINTASQPSMKTASSRLLSSRNCCSMSEPSSWKSGTSSSTWYPVPSTCDPDALTSSMRKRFTDSIGTYS